MKPIPRAGLSQASELLVSDIKRYITTQRSRGHKPSTIALSCEVAEVLNKSLRRITRDKHACITDYTIDGWEFYVLQRGNQDD